jgi:hypothetical protein
MYRGFREPVTWDDNYSVPDQFSDWSQGWRDPSGPHWESASQAVRRLLALEVDWDGEGAPAPDQDVVKSVATLLAHLQARRLSEPPTRVLPTSDGGILVEWQGHGYYRQLEVFTPCVGEVMTVVPGREPRHEEWYWESIKRGEEQRDGGESLPVWTDQRVATITHNRSAAA